MNKLIAALLLALVAACAGPAKGPTDIALYDFGPATPPSAALATAHAGLALEVRLPVWLDSTAIVYRLAYADPQRVHQYARARWAAQPSPLLQQRLRQSLAIAPGSAACTLRIELDEFAQVFDSAASSRAVLRGEALLLGKGRAQQARMPLNVEQPASSADAPGGVHALAAAADAAANGIATWLQRQDLAACRPKS